MKKLVLFAMVASLGFSARASAGVTCTFGESDIEATFVPVDKNSIPKTEGVPAAAVSASLSVNGEPVKAIGICRSYADTRFEYVRCSFCDGNTLARNAVRYEVYPSTVDEDGGGSVGSASVIIWRGDRPMTLSTANCQ